MIYLTEQHQLPPAHIERDGAPTLATIQGHTAIMAAVATLKSRGWEPYYKGTVL